MPDELDLSISLKYTPSVANQVAVRKFTLQKLITMTGGDFTTGTQVLSVSEEALGAGADLGTVGIVAIKNLDAVITIQIGLTGSMAMQLLAQESCVFRANGSMFVQAASGTPSIQFWAFEL